MNTMTLTREPRTFVPTAANAAARLAFLDPRPLWPEPTPAANPWKSPGFYLAGAIVLPLAAVALPIRALRRLV